MVDDETLEFITDDGNRYDYNEVRAPGAPHWSAVGVVIAKISNNII